MTFAEASCAYEVIDKFQKDSTINKYDIRFGGRRKFCKQSYADLGKFITTPNLFMILNKQFSFRLDNRQRQTRTASGTDEIGERIILRRSIKAGQKGNRGQEVAARNLNKFNLLFFYYNELLK